MAGLFTRAALADDLYRQRQREREDREFELLKRRDEQARLAQKEYLRPFETKELQAQFEDSVTARKDRDEQKVLTNWITPYQPSVGMNDDGTRQLDAKVPTDPAIAGLMAAGLGNAGGALDGFMQPFREQLGSASLKYNVPEEIKEKADQERAHQMSLELAKARKSDPRPILQKPASPKPDPRLVNMDKDARAFREKVLSFALGNFLEANNNRQPTPDEWRALGEYATKSMYANFPELAQYHNPTPVAQPPHSSGEPANTPTSNDPADEFDAMVESLSPTTVGLEEKQASTLPPLGDDSPGADMTTKNEVMPPQKSFIEEYTRLKPDSWLMKLFQLAKNPPPTPKGRRGVVGGTYTGIGMSPGRNL